MSSPAGGAGAAGQAAPTAAAQQPATTQQAPTAAQAAPAPRASTAPAQPEEQKPRPSTPRLLRLARGLATAAALLTGVVATGTFDTGGVNPTPNVIASQWAAAEETRVDVAEADLVAARALTEQVAGGDVDTDEARSAFEDALTGAADAHSRSGTGGSSGQTAAQIVRTGLLVSDALAAAGSDTDAAVGSYAAASELAHAVASRSEAVAEQHATDLQTGSRSALTATVGLISTILMAGIFVWLALRTRRIVNVPLLAATVITGWLTYVSLNPTALPLSIDQQVDEASAVSTALQEVKQARQAEYATVLGLEGVSLDNEASSAQDAVRNVEVPRLAVTWQDVRAGHDAVASAEDTAAGLEAIRQTDDAYAELEDDLERLLDDRLTVSSIGTPAAVTSGVALLLGLIAAAMAWTGLTQRLRDYR